MFKGTDHTSLCDHRDYRVFAGFVPGFFSPTWGRWSQPIAFPFQPTRPRSLFSERERERERMRNCRRKRRGHVFFSKKKIGNKEEEGGRNRIPKAVLVNIWTRESSQCFCLKCVWFWTLFLTETCLDSNTNRRLWKSLIRCEPYEHQLAMY